MLEHKGSCHCGAIQFQFQGPAIDRGMRCNCSICARKGALMSVFTVAPSDLTIVAADGALSTYEFGSGTAKHHFCSQCGIYPFHQTVVKPGHYRINLGCLEGVDTFALPFDVFDGATLM
ncbi:GFA family protein [Pseudomonas sp. B392_1p]|uniref:GFA family protein n=2 Tax=Serpens gallinarum TaxID=2763075 RepID=A0ABR8TSD6_9PSED|nr:GFA family protein [Serpens gallinarum]